MELDSGEWEGEYLDVRGFRGDIRMELDAADGEVQGSFRMTVPDEDEVMEFEGELRGVVEEDRVRFELPPMGRTEEPIETTADLESALPYATQALVGRIEPVKALNFGGGPWIAWHFERVRAGGE